MYKVIKAFADLHDDNHDYEIGDVFPREGIDVKPERLAELAGSDNKQGTPLIEEVKAAAKKPVKKAAGETPAE